MSRPDPVPPASGLRRAVERRSGPILVVLAQQPKLLIPVVSIVLLIVGLALPGLLGAPFLILLLLLVGWLSYLSWPVVVGPARLVRALSVTLIAVLLLTRLF